MKTHSFLFIIVVLLPFMTRSQVHDPGMAQKSTNPAITKAICIIQPTGDNKVTGTVTFTKAEGGIRVVADLRGLTPGNHGFHIHEFGDISSADGSSAGGHFNPTGHPHAGPMDKMRHEGDMGNITADEKGNAHLDYVDPGLSFDGPNSIIGRSVVVHKDPDDLKSQPAGNAGPRIGYGVIGIAK